ncbi:MAG: hypothetical protein ACI4MM_05025 [Candidatus Ventricola sp.]
MDETKMESEITALADSLTEDTDTDAQESDVTSEQLMEEEAPHEEQAQDQPEKEVSQSPEDARAAEIRSGVQDLFDAGWPLETLQAFSKDEAVLNAIAGGKSVAQAANAYAMRMMSAGQEAKPHVKTGVPSVRKAASSDAKPTMSIADMDDKQFEAFSRRAQQAAMEGKKVRM